MSTETEGGAMATQCIRGRARRSASVLGTLEIGVPRAGARELDALRCQVRQLESELCETERQRALMTTAFATLVNGLGAAVARLGQPCASVR